MLLWYVTCCFGISVCCMLLVYLQCYYGMLQVVLALVSVACYLSICNCYYGMYKVRKTARIRNPYNQVLHLSHDTKWESNKITINITNKSQEVSLFPSGDRKGSNKQTRKHQEKYCPGSISKIFYQRAQTGTTVHQPHR